MKDLRPLDILYEALHAGDFGLSVLTSDPERAKQAFYKARREAFDPDLSCLQFRTSPTNPSGAIWIVRGTDGKENRGRVDSDPLLDLDV